MTTFLHCWESKTFYLFSPNDGCILSKLEEKQLKLGCRILCFEPLLTSPNSTSQICVQTMFLQDLAEAQNQDDIHDIEIDLMSLLPALTLAFDSNTHFHIKNRDEDLPGRFHITDEIWAKALPETDIQDQTADSEITSQVEPVSQFLWLEHLINNFGEDGGIEHIQLVSFCTLHFGLYLCCFERETCPWNSQELGIRSISALIKHYHIHKGTGEIIVKFGSILWLGNFQHLEISNKSNPFTHIVLDLNH